MSGKIKKIFIVDDDEMIAKVLKEYLTRTIPHPVSIFSTGEECLQKLYEEPDVIILDYYMHADSKEAADGLELLSVIKKELPAVHVIMLSSQERYGVALQSIQKGAERYVIKDESAFEEINAIINEI
jgi:CheY-like chemotaxis protein